MCLSKCAKMTMYLFKVYQYPNDTIGSLRSETIDVNITGVVRERQN